MTGRDGCHARIAAVGRGPAGAVRSLAVSRLARAGRDGSRRRAIGALPETLVRDAAGGSAPGPAKDRRRLGCQGPMRAGGTLQPAADGPRRGRPPAGWGGAPTGQRRLDPDAAVPHAVRLGFARCAPWGAARAVVTPCPPHHRRLPPRLWGQRHARAWVWAPWRHGRGLAGRHHPASAGTDGAGRTTTRPRPRPGAALRRTGRSRRVTPGRRPRGRRPRAGARRLRPVRPAPGRP
jgi:hypothetical protein